MIRANTEQNKHTPWFAKAGAACSIVPISRFVGPHIFALKGGGYGCLFSMAGIDEEGLTDQELDAESFADALAVYSAIGNSELAPKPSSGKLSRFARFLRDLRS